MSWVFRSCYSIIKVATGQEKQIENPRFFIDLDFKNGRTAFPVYRISAPVAGNIKG